MERVLVVDDELPVARALERWLLRHHIETTVLCEPAQFLEALVRVRPTAVVCDYVMPGVDGVTVLRQCLAAAPEVKRCLLSGSMALVTEAQRASITPCLFLDKPWDDAGLRALKELLGGAA